MSKDAKQPETKEEVKEEVKEASETQTTETQTEDTKEAVIEDTNEISELKKQNEELLKTLGETNKLMTAQRKIFDSEINKLSEKFKELEVALPKRQSDAKAQVTGYYDFDSAHNRLINEEAQTDQQRAFRDIETLNSYFR